MKNMVPILAVSGLGASLVVPACASTFFEDFKAMPAVDGITIDKTSAVPEPEEHAVAENGGGKTAILDGIAAALTPLLGYLSTANQRLSGPGIADSDFRVIDETRDPDPASATVSDYAQVMVETTAGLKWDVWRSSRRGKQPPEKIGLTDLARDASNLLDSLATPRPRPFPVVAYYGARRGWIEIPREAGWPRSPNRKSSA